MNNEKSLLAQKEKIRWLKDGDINNKLFHRFINKRRVGNGVIGLEIGGEWVDEPSCVKEAVRDHFRKQYQKKDEGRVEIPSGLVESRLDEVDGKQLIRPFSELK